MSMPLRDTVRLDSSSANSRLNPVVPSGSFWPSPGNIMGHGAVKSCLAFWAASPSQRAVGASPSQLSTMALAQKRPSSLSPASKACTAAVYSPSGTKGVCKLMKKPSDGSVSAR